MRSSKQCTKCESRRIGYNPKGLAHESWACFDCGYVETYYSTAEADAKIFEGYIPVNPTDPSKGPFR